MSRAALAAPVVSVRAEGSAVAGSDYSLFCDVTIPPLLGDISSVSSPSVTWTYPSGETLENSVQLKFSPLSIDDEGTYNCTAYYFVGEVSSPSSTTLHHISISKSYFCSIHFCSVKLFWYL